MAKLSKFDVEYQETARFGNKQFHILSSGLLSDSVMTEICSLHWHNEFEFSLITEGETNFFIENEKYTLHAPDIVFINSRQIHMRENLPQKPCSYFSIAVEPRFLGVVDQDDIFLRFCTPILSHSIKVQNYYSSAEFENQFLIETLKKISRVLDQKNYAYELLIRAYLYEIFYWIYDNHKYAIPEIQKESVTLKEIKRITDYINKNYTKDISIDDLAGLCNLSKNYLIRLFSKYARQTPISYINSIRLHKAAQMLAESDQSVSDIALSVGFNNISYFSKIFKRQFDCSPSEYKASHQLP